MRSTTNRLHYCASNDDNYKSDDSYYTEPQPHLSSGDNSLWSNDYLPKRNVLQSMGCEYNVALITIQDIGLYNAHYLIRFVLSTAELPQIIAEPVAKMDPVRIIL